MDFCSHLMLTISVIVLVTVLYNLQSRNKYKHKNKFTSAPEASGGLPIIGHLHLLGGPKTLSRTLGEMADKHGPVFRIQLGVHQVVVISSCEAIKECLTTNDRVLASRPQSTQAKHIGYNYAALLFAPYGLYWRNIRKLATVELLSKYRIKSMKHFYEDEVNELVKKLYFKCNASDHGPVKIDISTWLVNLVLNIITQMIAGKKYFDGTDVDGNDEEGRPIGKILKEVTYIAGVGVPSDLIPFLRWIDFRGLVRSVRRLRMEIDPILGNWIEEHKLKRMKGDMNFKQDFIDVMLSTIQDDMAYGHPRDTIIKATAMTFNFAASDTTSITLTWVLSNLLNHRRALQLTQEELDRQVGRERVVQDFDIQKLVYLQSVVKETLRLYPAGPVIPREATSDCFIGNYHIPKGTRIFLNLWKLHRDPNAWSNPNEFIPERFLTSHENLDVFCQYYKFLPFGSGRRSCPGINLATQVLHLALARLLQAFDWTTPMNQPVDLTEGLGLSLPKASPLEVMLTPRLASELYQH